jgi:hypothetical protein
MVLECGADRRMWRLAVMAVLVAVLAMRTEGARISLPNPDAGDREGRHWLDQAGAPGGSAEGSDKDHNGPDDGPDPPWWFVSYVMLHESIRQGRRPARYVVYRDGDYLGCAGYGNWLYGIVTSHVNDLVTGKLTPHACSSERLFVYAL